MTEETSMDGERRQFTSVEKVAILREHLLEGVPVSTVCERRKLRPTLFYRWQQQFFENGAAAFEAPKGRPGRKADDAQARKIEALEAKLKTKNEVLAELVEEHVALKKTLGSSERDLGAPGHA
jgi:transposase